MSINGCTTEDLIRIANAGGGFRLNVSGRKTEDLIHIANAASNKGATVIFTGLSEHTTDELIRIGNAGKGSVIFED